MWHQSRSLSILCQNTKEFFICVISVCLLKLCFVFLSHLECWFYLQLWSPNFCSVSAENILEWTIVFTDACSGTFFCVRCLCNIGFVIVENLLTSFFLHIFLQGAILVLKLSSAVLLHFLKVILKKILLNCTHVIQPTDTYAFGHISPYHASTNSNLKFVSEKHVVYI